MHPGSGSPPRPGLRRVGETETAVVDTRELALQIAEQFEALGAGIGLRCAVLVGGIDIMAQAIALGKRPHVVVGTPGRVVDTCRTPSSDLPRRSRVFPKRGATLPSFVN